MVGDHAKEVINRGMTLLHMSVYMVGCDICHSPNHLFLLFLQT